MTLAITNVSTALAKAAISESINNVKGLCISSNINEWALHKPANYGAGNDAWTPFAAEPWEPQYVKPTGISSDTTGHRLGDFRGYNHDAKPPRYFDGNYADSYPQYTSPPAILVELETAGSEMSPTLDNDGFSPDYIRQVEDVTNEDLIAIKFYLDGVEQSPGQTVQDWLPGTISQNLMPADGVYTLTAKYWTRATSDAHDWVERVDVEGGSVTLTMTETDPEFHISSVSSPDDPVEFFSGSNDFTVVTIDVDFTVVNDIAGTINYTFFWEIGDKSGTIAIFNTSLETKDYSINIVSVKLFTPSELFQMRIDNSIGEIIFDSAYNITVTNLA